MNYVNKHNKINININIKNHYLIIIDVKFQLWIVNYFNDAIMFTCFVLLFQYNPVKLTNILYKK